MPTGAELVVIAMPTIGVPELLVILVILIVVFGASRIAGIGGALGSSIREFKKAVREGEEEPAGARADAADKR